MMISFHDVSWSLQTLTLKTIEFFTLSSDSLAIGHYPVTLCLMDKKDALDRALHEQLKRQAIKEGVKALTNDYETFFRCALKADLYQLTYLPAIVFNGEAVIYGINDIDKAVSLWKAHYA